MRKNPLVNKGEQTKIPFSFAENPPSSFPPCFIFFISVLQQQQQQQQQSEGFLLQQLQITWLASNVVRGPGLLQRQSFISQPPGIIRAPFHLSWQRGGGKRQKEGEIKKE